MGAALIVHVIRERKKIKEAKPKLLWGLLALSAVYLLSGIGSEHYATIAGRNIFHALLQIAAIMAPYLLFTVFVDWKNVRLDYFAWVGFGAGCLLSMEILGIYCTQEVIVDGIVRRERIYTGWGMYNNMGGLLAMMIPYAFCLATKYRKGWIGTLAGSVLKLNEGVRNMATYGGVTLPQALQMVTENPARLLGLEKEMGTLQPGTLADFVLLDEACNIRATFVGGNCVYVKE
jgi:hypothetical protein